MKKYIYHICIAVVFLTFALPVNGQKVYDGQINVTPYELRQRGDTLYMDIDFDFAGLMMESDRSLTLIPVLIAPNLEQELPPVIVNGKRRHKVWEREQALKGKYYEDPNPAFAVVKSDIRTRESVRYRMVMPYEDWMEDARLDLKQDLCGCGGQLQQISIDKLIKNVSLEERIPYEMQPKAAYIKPPVEEIKTRSEKQEAYLEFQVAKTNILPDFGNNPVELAKIEKMIREIRDDRNITVNRVGIIGFASPEGGVATNNRLSAGRAEALKNYLSMRSGFAPSLYAVEEGGENWGELAEMVEKSYLPQKEQILSIIKYTANPDQRKSQLKALNGGTVWRQMLNEMFPRLRKVVSRVDFTVRGFNADEAREVIKTNPQLLSLEEMFMAANTYPMESPSFVDVFETAVRMYPEDQVANHNAAATALMLRDLTRAERYLERCDQHTAAYKNNVGLLHLMRGEYDQARTVLTEAQGRGSEEATHNLEELNKKLESEGALKRK